MKQYFKLKFPTLVFCLLALQIVCFGQSEEGEEEHAVIEFKEPNSNELGNTSPIEDGFSFIGEWENDTIQNGKRVNAGQIHWKLEENGNYTHLLYYQYGTYSILDKYLTLKTKKEITYEILNASNDTLILKQIKPNFGLVSPKFTMIRQKED